MGGNNVTVKGLKLIIIDQENKKIGVSGPVPGGRNGEVNLLIK
jgi:ribosomal protein L3